MRVYPNKKEGGGLISNIPGSVPNKSIDLLPVELHLPGYQYCEPGTKLAQRLQKGDPGINKLDAACNQHDIAYSKYSDTIDRAKPDKELAERASQRVKSNDASLGEKAAAWAVTNIMKAKSKIGAGLKKKKRNLKKLLQCIKGKGLYLKPYKKTGAGIKQKINTTKAQIINNIPIRPLSTNGLLRYVYQLKIKNF